MKTITATTLLSFLILLLHSVQGFQQPLVQHPLPQQQQRTATTTRFHKALQALPHYECATAAVMSGLGDVLAQIQERKKNKAAKFNLKRTLQFMMKGVGEGFFWAFWYKYAAQYTFALTRTITKGMAVSNPVLHTTIETVVALVLDLTLACPFIYALWDIPFPLLLRGAPLRDIPKQIRKNLSGMLLVSAKVWTPVNILIYNIPVQYRVYLNSVADAFWQAFVSTFINNIAQESTGNGASFVSSKQDSIAAQQESATTEQPQGRQSFGAQPKPQPVA